MRPHRHHRAAVLATILAGTLGACSPTPSDGTSTTGSAGVQGYPMTVDNCGTQVTVESAPQRIVTVKSSATETVLALGLGDRLVGTAFPDGALPDALAAAGEDLPIIAERVPSYEVVLETEPDLVFAGWESVFAADGAGERQTLANLGIATYVSPAACKEAAYQPNPLTFAHVFDEIEQAGALLGAPAAAEALVADQRAQLAAVEPSTAGLSALWYSSGTETPFVGAGIGAPAMVLEAAGLSNVAGDVADTWASLSWEAVADRDPDVIVLVDSSWNTAAHKKDVLADNPTTAQLSAVRAERYVVVPFPASEAGVRSVAAVTSIVQQLAALDLEAPGAETP